MTRSVSQHHLLPLDCAPPDIVAGILLERGPEYNCFPLSFAQERIWFSEQLAPGTAAYNIAGAVRLEGGLDAEALKEALREIVRRHEALRTSFHQIGGAPFQQIHQQVDFKLRQADLRERGLGIADPERVRRELKAEAVEGFQLSEPRLMRALLLRTGEREHVLALVLHHIIADGWSIGVIIRELSELYDAYHRGRPSPLPALDIHYADYAVWQREQWRTGVLEQGLTYWRKHLQSAPMALALPFENERRAESGPRGGTVRLELGEELSRELRNLSRREGTTLFVVLLAAFHTLLVRYTGQHDIVVGTPMGERHQIETQDVVGLFVNLVAIRVGIDEGETFLALLRRVKEVVLQAQTWQNVPFEKIVDALGLSTSRSSSPLIQVTFAWQAALMGSVRLGDAAGTAEPIDTETAKFDLSLMLDEDGQNIAGRLEYRSDLFAPGTAERTCAHYVNLLRSAVAAPSGPIRDLQLMTGSERERLLSWSRGEQLEFDQFETALELFDSCVTKYPDTVALESDGKRMTYLELDSRANDWARYLRRLGIGEEKLVGICMDRGPEATLAMLAVLKSGAAYLPLDPAYPVDRLQYMLVDAGVSVLCTHRGLVDRCPAALSILLFDENQPDAGAPPTARRYASPDHLAYTIYTSGSTGRPKGVQIPHRGLRNLALWHRKEFGLGPRDRTTQFASLSFDASVWEIWSTLCAGATLCFPPSEIRTSPAELRDWLVENGITVSFLPTPVAERVMALEWPSQAALRVLLTGGDRLRSAPANGLPFRLVNNYGPTEASVVATSGAVAPNGSAAAPPIGRAIANSQAYVLDTELRLVPAGVTGELYMGGEGVARGYYQRPDTTAERFVPDPWSGPPGARMYSTGDLACYSNDGTIRFLGRADAQIKIRGHRVEPGEIAAVLKEVPGVEDALVDLRTTDTGAEPLLTAYVVSTPGVALATAELREHARRHLPGFMVPGTFSFLDAWPLTPNGKIDRTALPRPDCCGDSSTFYTTPAEEIVGAIWSTLLGRSDIGPRSDFFALGGHSLLAAQMIVRLRSAFSKDVPLRWAFEFPILRDLAAAVSIGATHSGAHSAAITRVDRGRPLRPSLAQERLWFIDQFTGSNSAYNITGAVRLRGDLDSAALEKVLREVVRRHEVLRTSFLQKDGVPVLRIHDQWDFALRWADVLEPGAAVADPHRLNAELKAETSRSFRLSEPTLMRASLLRTGEQEHVLVLVLHHIIADGWSIGVLVRELNELYDAYRRGRPSPLHDLEIQYVDYAAWQLNRLSDGSLGQGLAYWKDQLRGAPEMLALPFDHARPAESGFSGGTVRLELSEGLSRELRRLSRREGVTLFVTLLAGFKAVLARYTGQHDIAVGTDIANRNHAALEPLVGLFVNQLVLRTNLDGDPPLSELLARVKSVVLDAWAHQDVPFGKVVEALRPRRDLTRNPLFQVMVILQSVPIPDLEFSGVAAQSIEIDPEGSAFDLSLAFTPRDHGSITASLRYSGLFESTTAERILGDLRSVLERLVHDSEARISSLEVANRMEHNNGRIDKPRRKRDLFEGLSNARPMAAASSTTDLVRVEPFSEAQPVPVLVQPRSVDVELAAWVGAHRAYLCENLQRASALLFRGFRIDAVEQFQAITRSFSTQLIEYAERSSPRTKIGDGVYTSTDHPADQPILLHNEQSYTLNWPRKIWFFCLQPSPQGGRTPIADSRKILKRLRPKTVNKFIERQVMYVRNYGDGLGLPWTEAFQTEDRSAVEEHCRGAGIDFEWKGNARLRTRQVRPAVRNHPETGELVWFNHALFFHISSLPPTVRSAITAGVPEQDLPFNTYYGDGSPIEPSVLEEIHEAYDRETLKFDWQKADVLLLDNMLAAHGREPFSGSRKILVALTEPFEALHTTGVSTCLP
jgi:amino acid adenylation domain-containing protein